MDGPFTDDDARQIIAIHQTQAGIQAFIRKAAEIMAEAGRASQQALGHSAEYAIGRWCDVMKDEARRLVREANAENRPAKSQAQIGEMLKIEGPKHG